MAYIFLHQALRNPDKEKRWDAIKEAVRQSAISWALWGSALGVSWIISELLYVHMRRKASQQADIDALNAFGGNIDEYLKCLRQAYSDQLMAHQQHRGAERLYSVYVADKIDAAKRYIQNESVTTFLYNALEQCQQYKEKSSSPSPHELWFATTQSLNSGVKYQKTKSQREHDGGTADSHEDHS